MNYKDLYIYNFAMPGTHLYNYNLKTFWIESITTLIFLSLLFKYLLYILLNFRKNNNSNLLATKLNFTIIIVYLIFSGYFTDINYCIHLYYNDKLYSQSTYDQFLKQIEFQSSDAGRIMDWRAKALYNFNIFYKKPTNDFTKILNYIFKEPIDSNEVNFSK